jgi:tRNA pseudouridine55 synthase
MATGLLVVGIGAATRLLNYLDLEPKEYVFTARIGQTTTTYDAEGAKIEQREVPTDLASRIRSTLPQFIGEIDQIPPPFSAIKVEGRPLYAYARKGVAVDVKPRRITVHELTLTGMTENDATFRVVCSGGTYVRSIAHDLGAAVGCGAHVVFLRRTSAGRFNVEQSVAPDEHAANNLMSVNDALSHLTSTSLSPENTLAVQNGRTIVLEASTDVTDHVLLTDKNAKPLGIGTRVGKIVSPVCMMPREEHVSPS